jgi:hypothetical protein
MKKQIFLLLIIAVQVCKAQNDIQNNTPGIIRINPVLDNSRKSLSLLDELLLAVKSFYPKSNVGIKGDTLVTQFFFRDLKIPDSLLMTITQAYYDGFAMVLKKDSVKQRYLGVQICKDAFDCGTALFDMKTHNFDRPKSLKDKLNSFLYAGFWSNSMMESPKYKRKKSLIICYYIDTLKPFSQKEYVESIYQCASATIGNQIYQHGSKDSKQYKELLVLFCRNGRLAYFWRFPISARSMDRLYSIKFYESSLSY